MTVIATTDIQIIKTYLLGGAINENEKRYRGVPQFAIQTNENFIEDFMIAIFKDDQIKFTPCENKIKKAVIDAIKKAPLFKFYDKTYKLKSLSEDDLTAMLSEIETDVTEIAEMLNEDYVTREEDI